MSAHHNCAPNRPDYSGQAVNPPSRAPYVCRWCGVAELQPGDKRDFATLTDQWRLPDLCTPCAVIIGEYVHTHFAQITTQMRGLVNGLAGAGRV